MSQDSHTLHLHFDSPVPMRLVQLLAESHARDDAPGVERWSEKLGVSSDLLAVADWFNVQVSTDEGRLVLNYDSGTGGGSPLAFLEALGEKAQLLAAVLETFHDQVGESSAQLFHAGRLVSPGHLREAVPSFHGLIARLEQESEDEALHLMKPSAPVDLAVIRASETKRQEEAMEAVKQMREAFKIARESKTSVVDVLNMAQLMATWFPWLIWMLGALVVGVLLLVFTDTRWWGVGLLVWWLVAFRFTLKEVGEGAWHYSNWNYHVPMFLTVPVLVGWFHALAAEPLQWAYAAAAGGLAAGALYLIGDALFGNLDEDEGDAPKAEGEADDGPTPRWMHVLGTVLFGLPMFLFAVLGVTKALALPVIAALLA